MTAHIDPNAVIVDGQQVTYTNMRQLLNHLDERRVISFETEAELLAYSVPGTVAVIVIYDGSTAVFRSRGGTESPIPDANGVQWGIIASGSGAGAGNDLPGIDSDEAQALIDAALADLEAVGTNFDLIVDRLANYDIENRAAQVLDDAAIIDNMESFRRDLQSSINDVNAQLSFQQLAATSPVAALAQQKLELQAEIADLRATLTDDFITLVDVNGAIAQNNQNIGVSDANGLAAAVDTRISASLDAGGAISDAIQTVSSTGGSGGGVSVSQFSSAINGIKGVYGVDVENNGVTSGFALISDLEDGNATSSMTFDVDRFTVGRSTSDARAPFIISNNQVQISDAVIGNAQIKTLMLDGNAVTVPRIATRIFVTGNGSWQTVMSFTITMDVAGSIFAIHTCGLGYRNTTLSVGRQSEVGVSISDITRTIGGTSVKDGAAISYARNVQPGTYTVSASFRGDDQVQYNGGTLYAIGAKR